MADSEGGVMRARLASRIGTRYSQDASWGECGSLDSSRHYQRIEDWPTEGIDPSFTPAACDVCGSAYDGSEVWRGAGSSPIYDTPSGKAEPGVLYWVRQHDGPGDGFCTGGWTNCDGWHLHAVLPNGHHWDIDSRASNCGSPQDTLHRCWVRHGEPPEVHVDKDGLTCVAGAGSIRSGDWHGFLHHGEIHT